jgi:hypothetical protein
MKYAVDATHLLKTKTKNRKPCTIVYFFCGGVHFRKWLMEWHHKEVERLVMSEAFEIDVSFAKSKKFPEITITKYSLRSYIKKCEHVWIDTDMKETIFICEKCNATIEINR